MSVTLTAAQLAAAIRLGDSNDELAEAQRLLTVATQLVTDDAPNAPDSIQNEAVVRIAGYLYDMPTAGRGDGYANPVRSSGAGRLLAAYRTRNLGVA